MEKLEYPSVKETIYSEQLDNGLQVYVLPKPGFQKTYATFATRYGSLDNEFALGDAPFTRVADGIAHFLEHKMFEEPTGDIFATFASQGASANAFTSFDRTVYLFTATEQVTANIVTLLDFVQNPYFTDENVEKEKGIIEQEINMYRDNPDWRVYMSLIAAMYQNHPVRIDIAGTVASIKQIDKETLYLCYETFYHPSNMMLFIVGGVDPEEILSLVRSNQSAKPFRSQGEIKRKPVDEPSQVKENHVHNKLPVSLPKCLLGFKEANIRPSAILPLRQEVATKMMLEALLGPSSALYQQLYDEGLISDGFGQEFNVGVGYAFSVIGGETRSPEELVQRLRQEIGKAASSGIDPGVFERTRRKRIGSYLRMLNSPEAIANEFTRYKFRDGDLFALLGLYEQISLEEANERLRTHLNWEQLAVSVVSSAQP